MRISKGPVNASPPHAQAHTHGHRRRHSCTFWYVERVVPQGKRGSEAWCANIFQNPNPNPATHKPPQPTPVTPAYRLDNGRGRQGCRRPGEGAKGGTGRPARRGARAMKHLRVQCVEGATRVRSGRVERGWGALGERSRPVNGSQLQAQA